MTAAYHDGMETVILLVLLASIDKNGALKDSLRSFLTFYKENRDLIASLAGSGPVPPPPEKEAGGGRSEETPPEKKDRPQTGSGKIDILEEYLRRSAV